MKRYSKIFIATLFLVSSFASLSKAPPPTPVSKEVLLTQLNNAMTICDTGITDVSKKDYFWHLDQKKCRFHPFVCSKLMKQEKQYTIDDYNEEIYALHEFSEVRASNIRNMIENHKGPFDQKTASAIVEEITPYVQNCKNAVNGIITKLAPIEKNYELLK
jgi:hypothetical protein